MFVMRFSNLTPSSLEFRQYFMGKEFDAVTCPFGVAGSSVKIERDLVKTEFIIQFVQPTTTLCWRANDGALFQMVRQ